MQLASLSDWDIQSYTVTGTSGKSTQCYSAKGQSLYVMKPDEELGQPGQRADRIRAGR